MNGKFVICRNRNFDGSWKDYLFNSQKLFALHTKEYFNFYLYFAVRTRYNNKNEIERKVVNDIPDVSSSIEKQTEKLIQLLEEQLAHSNQQNQELSKQIESLTQKVQHLTKMLFGSKTEKSKYLMPDGQGSLFDDESTFPDSEQTEEQSQQTISYTVVRKLPKKKRNDSLRDDVPVEIIHHHPENTVCDCCQHQMKEIGSKIVREEAKFIPASMMKVQHVEHAYECTECKKDVSLPARMKRGKAPQSAIQRSLASPSVLAKVIHDKFVQYLPLLPSGEGMDSLWFGDE